MTLMRRDGYACGCGAFHRIDGWAGRYWEQVLDHVCTVCHVKNTIKRGIILRTQTGNPTPQEAS